MENRRRLVILAMLMVLLVSTMSFFSTYHLYNTALDAQRVRMQELVQSQASLVTELGWLTLQLELSGGQPVSRDVILDHISRAHSSFQLTTQSGEFTVARRLGDEIEFLIVNGQKVKKTSAKALVSIDGPKAIPMQLALGNQTGTVVALDYRGVEVLAAYTPLVLRHELLGLVAKIDIAEIKEPFIRANLVIIAFGIVLTAIFILIFFKVSDPLIQNIKQSEQKYRSLVEGANNFIVRVDDGGLISFANQYAEEMLGPPDQSLIGRNFIAFLAPEKKHMDIESFVHLFSKELVHQDFETPFKNGQTGWISWIITFISGDTPEKNELLCVGYDMTRIHVESQAKREVEERFRGIAKASPVGIVITSVEGTLLYANEKMLALTATGPVDLAGFGWLERVHKDDRFMVKNSWFERNMPSQRRLEFRMTTKHGSMLWVLGQIVEIHNSQKDVVGNVMTFTDITQLKQATLEQKRLTAAIDQAAEIVIITDLKGSITYVNPAFERITGYSLKKIIGENPRILQSGEQDANFYKALWAKLERGETWTGRFINKKRTGERYTQESTIGPIRDDSNEIIGYVGVARDISQQLVIEGQLRQSQKLESIGELAAGIAHEINTPTQYVMSNLQYLEDSLATIFTSLDRCQELNDYLNASDQATEPMIQQLAHSEIDKSELEYIKEDVPNALKESIQGLGRISEIVQSVKQLAHPGEVNKSFHDINDIIRNAVTVSSNEWKYIADIDDQMAEDLPKVNCLKGEVGQVILNLIINGAHAIDANRPDREEKGTISLKTFAENDTVVIEVSDTGTGIPQDIIDRIFDPFFTTKDVGKGTGQGLAIAHNVVVNMHAGHIDVKTREGVGSTFVIKLPVENTG